MASSLSLTGFATKPSAPDFEENLEPYGRPDRDHWTRWWYFFILPMMPITAFSVLIVVFWHWHYEKWDFSATNQHIAEGSCSEQSSSSFERRFIIDITYGDYSFATAKCIDVVWDTLIAQLGRVVHGYILYRHVARKLLICFMEFSSVTYEEYITIQLSQSIYGTFSFLMGRLFQKNRFAVWLCLVGLTYLFAYMVMFATIWGAASGYISPSQRSYHMPDDTYVPLDSPHLSLCWEIDSERLGLPQGHVETGPNFSLLKPWLAKSTENGTWAEWDALNAPTESESKNPVSSGTKSLKRPETFPFDGWKRTIWDDIGPAAMGLDVHVSGDFQNIFGYAFTRRMIQIVYNSTGLDSVGYNMELVSSTTKEKTTASLKLSQNNAVDVTRATALAETLDFSSFEYIDWAHRLSADDHYIKYFNTWPMLVRPSSYILNATASPGPGEIPYNSTFIFNNTEFALEAPFLDVSHVCSHPYNYFTAFGNCVCYDGVPLSTDWYRDENLVCLDSSTYNWGFSSYIVYVGLVCELLWIVIALWVRNYCQWRSKLMKHSRVKRAGMLWSILELAEAVGKDLGRDSVMKTERDLQRRLALCEEIGYAADVDPAGNLVGVYIVSRSKLSYNCEEANKDTAEQVLLEDERYV